MKSVFFRVLDADDKRQALLDTIRQHTKTTTNSRFEVSPRQFSTIPRSPLAYWVSDRVRLFFSQMRRFQSDLRCAASGGKTLGDFRWLRTTWEISTTPNQAWVGFAKGGSFSPFYHDVHLLLDWRDEAKSLKSYLVEYRRSHGWSPHWTAELHGSEHYFRPGLTWPLRTQSGFGPRVMPAGCIFGHKGPASFVAGDTPSNLLALLAITTSTAFRYLVDLQMAFGSYEVGVIQRTPVPDIGCAEEVSLAAHARQAWSLKRTLDTVHETSHAFLLPALLRPRLGTFDPPSIHRELAELQRAIDEIAYSLYGLDGDDRAEIERWATKGQTSASGAEPDDEDTDDTDDDDDNETTADDRDTLLSWCVGVAFGRFDLRLATGERAAPPEPEPFDPLPAKSPGMVPEDLPPRPVLVDDPGHADDLTAQVRAVLARVEQPEPEDLRRWLARDFFPLHLRMYSRSRRKAPIYWQLATPSASYSVWLYLHAMSRDTLYNVQNEHVAAKLAHEERRLEALRRELGPTPKAAERKQLTAQEALVEELRAFLDEVKRVAPLWNPDLDDGVIINFAPLWRLVPHQKAWQKDLKATWDALCAGEYDWAHLAMHLWPERVVPKCATDRSLAIAHGLEDTFWVEGKDGKWKPRPAPARPIEALVRERSSAAVKEALKNLEAAPAAGGAAKRGRKGKSDA